jgi:hypothetical protein
MLCRAHILAVLLRRMSDVDLSVYSLVQVSLRHCIVFGIMEGSDG